MKHYFALGGLIGFALCFASALLAGSDADTALRDACVCSLIVAMLFRWLRSSLTSHFTTLLQERADAATAAASSVPAAANAQAATPGAPAAV